MTTQPEALRLAESISQMDTFTEHQRGEILKAAAELRRLHEENEKLRNAANRGGHMAVAWDEIKRLHVLNQKLLDALDGMVKVMVQKAVEAEREACAKVCESEWSNVAERMYGEECAAAIRARGNT